MSDPRGFQPHPPEIPTKAPDEPPGWFDKPENLAKLKKLAFLSVAVLTIIDLFIHYHVHVGGENIPGFYTAFGLIASVLLIVMAKGGGKPLKRGEDYYDE